MGLFSQLTSSLFPNQAASGQAQDLEATVEEDKKLLEGQSLLSQSAQPITPMLPMSSVVIPAPTHTRRSQSALSPFASRILEKAKIESLKSDDQRQKITSPKQIFATTDAMDRIDHIESIALERSKKSTKDFLHGARTIPNTNFLQRNGLNHK